MARPRPHFRVQLCRDEDAQASMRLFAREVMLRFTGVA
jgi:hypothetical protein